MPCFIELPATDVAPVTHENSFAPGQWLNQYLDLPDPGPARQDLVALGRVGRDYQGTQCATKATTQHCSYSAEQGPAEGTPPLVTGPNCQWSPVHLASLVPDRLSWHSEAVLANW